MLNSSAQYFQEWLLGKGLTYKVIELSSSTHTAQEAADALGCDVAQILKSLIFCTNKTQTPVLILASGVNRVNEKMLAHHLGEKIVKADADFTREVTGFAIGGIPPLGHKQSITTFIDEDLLQFQSLSGILCK